jgi:hypothetical protein
MRGRLLDEARQQGVDLDAPLSSFESTLDALSTRKISHRLDDALRSELALRLESAARARRALELLCRELKASSGQLYYARGAELARVASFAEPDARLDRFASGYWRQRQRQAVMTTVITAPEPTSGLQTGSWTNASGQQYTLLPLSSGSEAECVGLAALLARPAVIPAEYWALAAAISDWLRELGDVARGNV